VWLAGIQEPFILDMWSIWSDLATCSHWLGVYSTDPSNVVDHFLQLGTSLGYATSRSTFMILIWFASSW